MKAILKIMCSTMLILSVVSYAAPSHITAADHPVFSKLVIFGDSLSDVGNNQDGQDDQAPDTNRMLTSTGSRPGDVWVVPFVKYLAQAGYLATSDATTIIPSSSLTIDEIYKSKNSVDFAYSGDPSGGYFLQSNQAVRQYHSLYQKNSSCQTGPIPSEKNALCGVYNRLDNFVTQPPAGYGLDPNALYIVWVGPNDIQQNLSNDLLGQIISGNTIDLNEAAKDPKARQTIAQATFNISSSVADLIQHGAKYVLVINLPNLGNTAQGWILNDLYTTFHTEPDQANIIPQLFTNLTDGFNKQLALNLNGLQKVFKDAHIIQPNFPTMFKMAEAGEIAAFPKQMATVKNPYGVEEQINITTTMPWMNGFGYSAQFISQDYFLGCCMNETSPNYTPSQCIPDPEYKNFCSTDGLPHTPNGGRYLFFNTIHPTTCANKYIAKYAESYLPGAPAFDPSDNTLCDNATE